MSCDVFQRHEYTKGNWPFWRHKKLAVCVLYDRVNRLRLYLNELLQPDQGSLLANNRERKRERERERGSCSRGFRYCPFAIIIGDKLDLCETIDGRENKFHLELISPRLPPRAAARFVRVSR